MVRKKKTTTFPLRMGHGLRRNLDDLSAATGLSVNYLIVSIVAEFLKKNNLGGGKL